MKYNSFKPKKLELSILKFLLEKREKNEIKNSDYWMKDLDLDVKMFNEYYL